MNVNVYDSVVIYNTLVVVAILILELVYFLSYKLSLLQFKIIYISNSGLFRMDSDCWTADRI